MILPQESSEDYLLAASVTTPLSTPAYSSASHTAPIMPATETGAVLSCYSFTKL